MWETFRMRAKELRITSKANSAAVLSHRSCDLVLYSRAPQLKSGCISKKKPAPFANSSLELQQASTARDVFLLHWMRSDVTNVEWSGLCQLCSSQQAQINTASVTGPGRCRVLDCLP